MKLYTEHGAITAEAMKLDDEIHSAVKDIFQKYLTEGYNIREIAHVASNAIRALECEMALDLRRKKG